MSRGRFLRGGWGRGGLLAGLVLLAACGDGRPAQEGSADLPPDPAASGAWARVDLNELWRLGSRGTGYAEQHEFEKASDTWSQVSQLAPFWYVPRVNLGIATLNRGSDESELAAMAVFEEVLEVFPENPWAHFCLGILCKRAGQLVASEEHFRAVLAIDPADPDSYYHLGALLLEVPGRATEAAPLFRRALRANPVLLSAWYGLAEAEGAAGNEEERSAALREFRALKEGGGGVEREVVYGKMGFYADLIRPEDWLIPEPASGPPAAAYSVVFTQLEAPSGLRHGGSGAGDFAAWAAGNAPPEEASGGIGAGDLDADGATDLVLAHWGPGPDVHVLMNDGATDGARWRVESDAMGFEDGEARTLAVLLADFDGDGSLDLFAGRDGPDRVLAREVDAPTGPFARSLGGAEGGNEPTYSARAGDIDQDGDLDLLLGKRSGFRLLRWDGAVFEDVTAESDVLAPGPGLSSLLADVDGDDDLDILVGTPRPRAWLNDRLWRFHEEPVAGFSGSEEALASIGMGDVNGDALVDWVAASPQAGMRVLLADVAGGYRADAHWQEARASEDDVALGFGAEWLDADHDGDLDLLTLGDRLGLFLRDADGAYSDWSEECGLAAVDARGLRGHVLLDFEGDGDLDLAAVRNGQPPLLLRNDSGGAGGSDWIAIRPVGVLEPGRARGRAMGLGARVEVRAANSVRAGYAGLGGGFGSSAMETLYFQLAGEERADLRIAWPDQVVQTEFDLAGGRTHLVEQVDREASSCPLLFAWDGRHFDYVTDFLGVGGLGFLVEPGFYGPPDPEEVVRVGQQLRPKDGMLEIRVGEPMEEATFLDEVTLLAVDHPAGTEVHPEEHFATAEPMASGRPLCIATDERVFPLAARSVELENERAEAYVPAESEPSAHPRDDLDALLEIDRSYASPFSVHRRLLGYAGRWALELDFAADETLWGDEPVHLYVYGWVEYPYSRLNYAAWQAELAMESLSLEVPGGDGGWRTVRPQFGYMAGKPRTMAVDISEHLRAARVGERVRLRLTSNLAVHFDQVYLARDLGGRPGVLEVVERHPDSAVVGFAGFPREFTPDGADPPLFDYDHRDTASHLKTLAGSYTRSGEARDLLLERDDRFATFGRGEEVRLRFDPASFGDPGERERTWLLRARGYCKDMCPLTAEPVALEPLPFAAMENYPPIEPLGADHPSRLSALNRRLEPPRPPVR